ncbi:hypothetical protein M0R72_07890 [Candidatus Pacearchaeota archaeon]|jgi:hypothetical protein|nr:hypothetical protein [Candidatus Pacearchaeota archaeon]
MTDNKCVDSTRDCPLTTEYLEAQGKWQGKIETEIESMKKSVDSLKGNGTVKWIAVLVAVATLAFTAGQRMSDTTSVDFRMRFDKIEELIKETNVKIETINKDVSLRIDYNSNRLTRLEERTKP